MNSNNQGVAKRSGNTRGLGQHWYQSIRLMPRDGQSWKETEDNTAAFSEAWDDLEAFENPRTQHKTDQGKKNKDRSSAMLWYQRRNDILKRLKQLNLENQDLTVSKTRLNFNLDRKMKKARCYICFGRGHVYLDCPNKNRWHNFKKTHRMKANLYEKSEAKGQNNLVFKNKIVPEPNWLVLGSDQRGWDELWYVSNQYPRHMTPNLDQFEHFKAGTIGTSKTGEQGLEVKGFGEVEVSTEQKIYVIPGVYFVPNVGFNTLSLSQLVAQGFKLKIKGGTCVLMRQFEEGISEKEFEESDKDGNFKVPTKGDFDSLIGFMQMINEQELVEGCKRLVKEHFEKLVKWFYKEHMKNEKVSIPMKTNGTEICLLDLYLTVKGMGGHNQVIKDTWWCVAKEMGFPIECADDIKECYASCLSLLGIYYDMARNYSSRDFASGAADCVNASRVVAEVLPKEDAILGCVEPGATKMELDKDDDRVRIKFYDDETLVITFEEHQEDNKEEAMDAESSSSKALMKNED